MAREFQPYGATWAELKNKSGMARTTFKRGFDFAKARKWFVGGGGQNKPFFLNPDGCWRAALEPPRGRSIGSVKSNLYPETRDSEPALNPVRASDPNSKIDSIVALASEAIRYVDQKK